MKTRFTQIAFPVAWLLQVIWIFCQLWESQRWLTVGIIVTIMALIFVAFYEGYWHGWDMATISYQQTRNRILAEEKGKTTGDNVSAR